MTTMAGMERRIMSLERQVSQLHDELRAQGGSRLADIIKLNSRVEKLEGLPLQQTHYHFPNIPPAYLRPLEITCTFDYPPGRDRWANPVDYLDSHL